MSPTSSSTFFAGRNALSATLRITPRALPSDTGSGHAGGAPRRELYGTGRRGGNNSYPGVAKAARAVGARGMFSPL